LTELPKEFLSNCSLLEKLNISNTQLVDIDQLPVVAQQAIISYNQEQKKAAKQAAAETDL